MRTPPLLADFSHARPCKPFCENSLTLPIQLNPPEHKKSACHSQKENGKRRLVGFVFNFGEGKGAACLPRFGGWYLVFLICGTISIIEPAFHRNLFHNSCLQNRGDISGRFSFQKRGYHHYSLQKYLCRKIAIEWITRVLL